MGECQTADQQRMLHGRTQAEEWRQASRVYPVEVVDDFYNGGFIREVNGLQVKVPDTEERFRAFAIKFGNHAAARGADGLIDDMIVEKTAGAAVAKLKNAVGFLKVAKFPLLNERVPEY